METPEGNPGVVAPCESRAQRNLREGIGVAVGIGDCRLEASPERHIRGELCGFGGRLQFRRMSGNCQAQQRCQPIKEWDRRPVH